MEFESDDEVEEMESDYTQPEQDARLILGQNENNPNQPAMIKAMLKELLNEELSEIKESLKAVGADKSKTTPTKVNQTREHVKSPSDTTLYRPVLN